MLMSRVTLWSVMDAAMSNADFVKELVSQS
jgi:hypothetical protein